jgi:hypothetical protein
MNNHPDIETRLWEYIDGGCNETERRDIENLIAENIQWKAKYAELLELNRMLGLAELEEPSLRFTKNVMDEIARIQIAPAAKNYINNKVVSGIALFFIVLITGFLVFAVSQVNWSEATGSDIVFGIDITRVNLAPVFNNSIVNLFMMVNVVLALLLLDRYLAMKRNRNLKKM